MPDENLLEGLTKEELIKLILEQAKHIQEIEKKLSELSKKLKIVQTPMFVKAALPQRRRRRPGQKVGHEGFTRPKPSHIDEVIEQTLRECPDCHESLGKSAEVLEHIQEDIVPATVKVTCFKRHRYWCASCKKMITAPYHESEVPHGYLGANVLIQTALLKYHHALPYQRIAELLEQLTGLKVTEGALAQALQRLSNWLLVEKKEILKAIRESPHLHIDETGWRMDGKNHWLWAFVNQKLAYYTIDKSRARKVPRNVLSKEFKGTITTDFYSAYLKLPGDKQKCLVHLFREMRRIKDHDDSKEYGIYSKKIKRVLDDAIRLSDRRDLFSSEAYNRRVKFIKERLFRIACYPYTNENLKRLSKRFLTHWLGMLLFLEKPGADWNNNLAERMIRPNVIYRNRSFGNRSLGGARAHSTMMSLIQTLRLQKKNVFQTLKDAFILHRQGNPTPVLV